MDFGCSTRDECEYCLADYVFGHLALSQLKSTQITTLHNFEHVGDSPMRKNDAEF
jgi:hypothetical protein